MSVATLFIAVAVALSAVMALAALAVIRGAKSGWVDAVWSFLVGAAGVTVALVPVEGWDGDSVRSVMVATLAGLWSLRLGLHIVARTKGGGEDPRYAALKEEWGDEWRTRMFSFLQIQAAAALLLAGAIFLAARNPAPGLQWSDIVGVLILMAAVVGEGVADAQLTRFRSENRGKGKVCDTGLWSLSRHPNYFFQWLGWTGYAVMAIGPDGMWVWGWAALAGPLFMYWLLVYASGIPPLEEHMMRSRGQAYAEYRRRVNAFWPGPQLKETPT
jgi:steroid 5-alpha reductase family enzyme